MANITNRRYKITVSLISPTKSQDGYEREDSVNVFELSLADFSMHSFMQYISNSNDVDYVVLKEQE